MTPIVPLGRYRHFKGNEYEVIGEARDSETLEPMIVYRALYGEHEMWARPLKSFIEDVVVDGVAQPRFKLL